MKLPYKWPKCITCCTNPADSPEHIIPESIGGFFELYLLCKRCNSECGSKIQAGIKYDPYILKAALKVRDIIPGIVKKIEDGQSLWRVTTDDHWIRSTNKNGKRKISTKKIDADNIISNIDDTARIISGKMRKNGKDINEHELKQNLRQMSPDKPIYCGPYKIAKNKYKNTVPDMTKGLFTDTAALLMAYEYLAILLRDEIYGKDWDAVRQAFWPIPKNLPIQNVDDPPYCKVSSYKISKPQPIHLIYLEATSPGFRVKMEFFGTHGKSVEFPNIKHPSKQYLIVFDLQDTEILVQESLQAAFAEGLLVRSSDD